MVAFLGLFMAIFMAIYAAGRRQISLLRPRRIDKQMARACLDMANNVCVVIALRHMTLTLFYILVFTAPMVIALLSGRRAPRGLALAQSDGDCGGICGSGDRGQSVWRPARCRLDRLRFLHGLRRLLLG